MGLLNPISLFHFFSSDLPFNCILTLLCPIGYAPKSELARDLGVNLNEKAEIIIDPDSKTSMPGVFAAGDITNTRFKQAIIGVAQAVTAAHSAYYYISHSAVMPFNGSGRKK